MSLQVYEIFRSIQGETTRAGFPSLFIRLAGCNLNCAWCDTAYARRGGTPMTVDEIIVRVKAAGNFDHVTVTGGEPLCQEGTPGLIGALLGMGQDVQVETNGSLPVSAIPAGARKIVDVKPPSSGEEGSFLAENLRHLTPGDELKFVVADLADYDYYRKFIEKNAGLVKDGVTVNISPVLGKMDPAALAEMMLADGLDARLNLQLHAIIWPGGEKKDS